MMDEIRVCVVFLPVRISYIGNMSIKSTHSHA